jgi:hypothetical protein
MIEREFADTERTLNTLTDRAEFWQQDHELAAICQHLGPLLAEFNGFFESWSTLDARWHEAVFRGAMPYRADEERGIRDFYQLWLDRAIKIMKILTLLEGQGCRVGAADLFRANLDEARGILTPDAEFFDDDALTKRQEEAIEAHRGGETVEFQEMGD